MNDDVGGRSVGPTTETFEYECTEDNRVHFHTEKEREALGKRGNIKMAFIEVESSLTMMQFTDSKELSGKWDRERSLRKFALVFMS